ncbi:hydrolase [Angelakisella massiliensis]|uniref:hydrolase n=1 Tax=Angelakisella massiliensis TaxID=1871018 RepID=UPI0008F8879B|nr:hydrolase [Angelakisella massiliensis]
MDLNLDYKQRFLDIYEQNIHREGAQELLKWLQGTDFFTAPASTRFHCACAGGLVMHSVSVYETMMEKHFVEGEDNPESFALCALLHDLCKAQFYKVSTRNVKNEQTGQWEKKPYYVVEDSFPYGHGEKSVFLIERFVRLKPAEATAIRWHMGGFDEACRGGSFAISLAYDKYPLAVKLHLADLESTYLREKGTSEVQRT